MWLKQLKIAIVQEDIRLLSLLLEDIPTLEDEKDRDTASCLLHQATQIVQDLKDKTGKSMQQIQKNIQFLDATQAPNKNTFDTKQ